MKTWEVTKITPQLKAASDALRRVQEFSAANPSKSLRENPFLRVSHRAHRSATGSVNRLWVCKCESVMPLINDHMRTECCNETSVFLG